MASIQEASPRRDHERGGNLMTPTYDRLEWKWSVERMWREVKEILGYAP